MVKSKVNDLDKLLSKTFGEPVQILDQQMKLLTAPGEHYGSVMLALNLTVERGDKTEQLELVAKLLPANEMLRKAFDIYVTFKKEVVAYTEAIPALTELQIEFNIPEDRYIDNIFPNCYSARVSLDESSNQVDDDGVLIFENLKLQGFETEDRLVGFDYDDTLIIVTDLARFHATVIACKLLRPEVFKERVLPCTVNYNGFETLPEEIGLSFHDSIMEAAREIIELKPYLDRLQKVVDSVGIQTLVTPLPNEPWGTMCHSDLWTSNLMIQKDGNGKAKRSKIVDLQLSTYTSAPSDLVFFLFTSVINSVLDKHIDDFIKMYHKSFVDTIKDFDIDTCPFSWQQFERELNSVGPNEIYHILMMLKPICTEREKIQHSAEDFQDSDWLRKDLLGPAHRKKVKETVLALVKMNWL